MLKKAIRYGWKLCWNWTFEYLPHASSPDSDALHCREYSFLLQLEFVKFLYGVDANRGSDSAPQFL